MAQMAVVLKSHIVKHQLYTPIAGRNYAHVEGWQFAGGLMGLFPRVVAVTDLSKGNESKWMAEVEIVNLKTGGIISRGFAVCSNSENKKKSFDDYAVLSMAQTRAIGKAFRNTVGWVMKLAGYEGTPKEEMTKVGEQSAPAATEPAETTVVYDEGLVCKGTTKSGCGNDITSAESNYSKKIFGKDLCRSCQKLATPIKRK